MSFIDITTYDVAGCTENGFLCDTNALIYTFYPNASPTFPSYSNFLSSLVANNKKIYIPMFYIGESLHVIEKAEYEIYKNRTRHISYKDYRRIPAERARIKHLLDLFLAQITYIPQIEIIEQTLELKSAKDYIKDYSTYELDYFDMLLKEISDKKSLPIITNDIDFSTCNCSQDIYTSNPNILALNQS